MQKRYRIAEIDKSGRVLSFEEKPREPTSAWGVPALYIYKEETLPLIEQYLSEGNNPDAPGHLIPWLLKRRPIYAFQFAGQWHDIGTLESYQEAHLVFAQ